MVRARAASHMRAQHPVRCCAPGVFRHSTPERVLPSYFGISSATTENRGLAEYTVAQLATALNVNHLQVKRMTNVRRSARSQHEDCEAGSGARMTLSTKLTPQEMAVD